MILPYVIETSSAGNEKMYDIYSRLLKDRIVFIGQEFTNDLANSVVAQLLFLESYDSGEDIYMYINSPGGDMKAMFAIYDTMNYIKPDIVTVGMGQVASAAALILATGTKGKRHSLPNTDIMIHQPSGGTSGQTTDVNIQARQLNLYKDRLVGILAGATGKHKKTILKDVERDKHLTPEEAVKYGLIDSVQTNR